MIKISYESFSKMLSRGYLLNEDISEVDEMYLKSIDEKSYYSTDFKYSGLKKSFPVELKYIEPFIKLRSTKTKAVDASDHIQIDNFNSHIWGNMWDHICYYYLLIINVHKSNPWGLIDNKDEGNGKENINGYYIYLNNLSKEDSGLYEFMFESHYPDEYVQMALLNQAVSNELTNMINLKKNNTKSEFVSFLIEKGEKWVSYLKQNTVMQLWENILEQSIDKNQEITKETIVLICYLFSLDAYMRRMNIKTSLKTVQQIIDTTDGSDKIADQFYFQMTLMHFISKIFGSTEIVKEISFLPDYYLLNYVTQEQYNKFESKPESKGPMYYVKNLVKKEKEVPLGIYDKLKARNNKSIKFLSIAGITKAKSSFEISIETEYLNQINNLPHYIYKIITKDLLRTSIEIHGFMKNKLGVSPEVLYRDFQSLKNNQQYDLTGKVDYDKWIENESNKLL